MYKKKLSDIVYSSKTNKHKSNISKYPEVYQWVINSTSYLPESTSFLERVYVCLNDENPYCQYNKKKKFSGNLNIGYYNCGRSTKCQCAKEHKSKQIQESWKSRDNNEVQEKKKKTNLKKYGVEHVMQDPKKVEERKQKCLNKFGETTNLKTQETKKKSSQTLLEKYNVSYPLKSKEILDKVQNTNLERYGNICSAQGDEVQIKIKNTMQNKYNVNHALQNSHLKTKQEETTLKRYGKRHYSQTDDFIQFYEKNKNEILEKRKNTLLKRYGVVYPKQKDIPKDSLEILLDKEKFRNFIYNKSFVEAASKLNVNSQTIADYIKRYDLDHSYSFSQSLGEKELAKFLESIDISYKQNDRKIIPPFELDIVIPEYNLAIEYCGLYWHSELNKPNKNYHKDKMIKAQEAGYNLITIFENEWHHKTNIIKSKILSYLGKNERGIGARHTYVTEINQKLAKIFLEDYHIQGSGKATKYYGCFHKDNLISVLSVMKRKNHSYEITRFSSDGRNNPGTFSKLLKYFINDLEPRSVYTFADLRYSNGQLYRRTGFYKKSYQEPSYWYTDMKQLYHRFNFRKKNIQKKFKIDITNKTEKQLMTDLGFARIWDCGLEKYEYIIK